MPHHDRRRSVTTFGVLLALTALTALASCGDDDDAIETSTSTAPPASVPTTPAADDDAGGAGSLPEEPSPAELEAAYVGLTTEDAAAAAEEAGVPWRVEREDGEDFALTMDYVPERVNFTVEDGIVTGVRAG